MSRLLLVTSLALATLAVPVGSVAAAPALEDEVDAIAVVDVQRCLLETKEGKRAKRTLEGDFGKGQARLDKKAKDLQKQVGDLQAKAAMLTESELNKRREDLMRADAELQQLASELQQHMVEEEGLLAERIYKNVSAIVDEIAAEENLDLVLVRSDMTVLYADPQIDLTNRVIVRYDKKHK
jgi:outer membrane protein